MRQAFSSDSAPRPGGSYSQVMQAGSLVFTAGMGPASPATGEIVGTTIEEQTAQVLDNLEAALSAAGLGLADVVKVTTHLAELKRDFAGYDAVYRSRMVEPYPVRTTVGSQLMNMLVEIDVVAVVPDAADRRPETH
nr:Rid family hydrolase [uncultured Friedmanniella sp.]